MPRDNLNRDAVRALMEARGVDSMSDLARRSKIERTYLTRILNGDRAAQPSHLVAIAAALKVPPMAVTGPGIDPAAAEIIEQAS